MAYSHVSMLRNGSVRKVLGLGALLLALGASAPAMAQDAPAAPAAADPAAAPAAADAGKTADANKGNFWVKLCDKVKFADPAAKDPKTAPPIEKKVCVIQLERIDPNSGGLLIYTALRDVEGEDKKSLMVTVPLGMVIPAGLHIFVDEETDVKKSIPMGFDTCLPTGCTGELQLTPEQLDQISKAKQITVVSISVQGGQQVPFRLPMGGFAKAMAGEPTDAAKFYNARKTQLLALRERLIAKQQATQAAAEAAVKGVQEDNAANGTTPAADATAAPAPAAPPKPKK